MRTIILAAFAITTFLTAATIDRTDANAVVCGRGPYRAGCVGPQGAVVAHRHYHGCRWVWVNGLKVRRCY
jgi:hypothetical protein